MKREIFVPITLPDGLKPYAQFFDRYRRELEDAFQRVSNGTFTGAVVKRTAALAVADSTDTDIPFDTEVVDSDEMFTATSTTVTLQTSGVWMAVLAVTWDNMASADRSSKLKLNGTQIAEIGSLLSGGVSVVVNAVAGDDFTVTVRKVGGGATNVTFAQLTLFRLGGGL